MRLILAFLLVALTLNKGTTYAELQVELLETITTPFVTLMFIYDSAAESTTYAI